MVTLGTGATVTSTTSITATYNGVTSPAVILTVTLAGSSSTNGLLTPRYDHTATLLHDGTVLVAGGYNTVALASAELYTPGSMTSTGTWTAAANMAVGRRDHTATLLSTGQVLLIGGGTASGDLTSAEMYTPASGVAASWTAYPGMLTQTRSYHTATLLNNSANLTANGKELVLVVGGGLASTADLVDPSSPPGTRATSVPDFWPRYSHTATLLNDGTVLVTGGFDSASASVLAQAELFAPTGASVLATTPLTTPRYLHSATLLANGNVLVVGGIDAVGNILTSAELYDPVLKTWTATGNLAVPRYGHIATLMTSGPYAGQVMVMGGRNASNPTLSSVEVYDPANRQWTGAANLQKGRAVFSATLLGTGPDVGSLLVVGGEGTVNGNYVVLPDVELHN